MIRIRLGFFVALVVAATFLVGCEDKKTNSGNSPPQNATGRSIFETQGCANCHAVGSTPAKGKGQSPDLGPLATNGKYTRDTLSAFIKNPPKSPYGGMPAYEGKIKDDDMGKLCQYLLGQQ